MIVRSSCSGKRQSRAIAITPFANYSAIGHLALNTITSEFYNFFKFFDFFKQCIKNLNITAKRTKISE